MRLLQSWRMILNTSKENQLTHKKDKCPFCKIPCGTRHCPYTEDEDSRGTGEEKGTQDDLPSRETTKPKRCE